MIRGGLSAFKGKRILLLQGPVGPFFARLARDLRAAGAQVAKINFNGGDALFYPFGAVAYRGAMDDWPRWFAAYLDAHPADVVLLFGDCRPLHLQARVIAVERGIQVGVFEEGYVRPDFITLEQFGVNGYSRIPREPAFYQALPEPPELRRRQVGNTFWYCLLWAILYYMGAVALQSRFRLYRHHRPLLLREGWPLVISAARKWIYLWRERGIAGRLLGEWSGRYFLVPLQVHNDSQIHVHSEVGSVRRFIIEVMRSFALHAPDHTALVIKHHPLDRAYHDYTDLIRRVAERHGIAERVFYIHDQHLPSLLQQARGVIVVNSTVGFSALYHRRPLKACGKAIYDIPGLTWQGSLHEFWQGAAGFTMDMALFQRYRHYLIHSTQLNGSFFRRLPGCGSGAGLAWERGK